MLCPVISRDNGLTDTVPHLPHPLFCVHAILLTPHSSLSSSRQLLHAAEAMEGAEMPGSTSCSEYHKLVLHRLACSTWRPEGLAATMQALRDVPL